MLWAPEMCHVAVKVGRQISVSHLDSSCLTEEPVCSSGCLPAEERGPAAAAAAAAEATAAAAAAMLKRRLRPTRQAAGRAAAVRIETSGQWAAG